MSRNCGAGFRPAYLDHHLVDGQGSRLVGAPTSAGQGKANVVKLVGEFHLDLEGHIAFVPYEDGHYIGREELNKDMRNLQHVHAGHILTSGQAGHNGTVGRHLA